MLLLLYEGLNFHIDLKEIGENKCLLAQEHTQLPTGGIKQLDLMSCSQLVIGYHLSFLQFCEGNNIAYDFVRFTSNERQWHNWDISSQRLQQNPVYTCSSKDI